MVHHFNRLGTLVAAATFATGAISATTLAQSATCATAQVATVGANAFDNAANTGSQLVRSSATGNATIYRAGWFSFTPATTGNYTLSVCGSVNDTRLAIGAVCPGSTTTAFNSLAFNDDACPCSSGCGTGGTASWSSQITSTSIGIPLTQALQAGTTYYIVVGGFGTTTPATSGTLTIAAAAPPFNPCQNVQVASLGANTVLSNASSPNLVASCATIGKASYLKFTAPASATYVVDTCAMTDGDTVLSVLTACGDASSEIACDDDTCDLRSEVAFEAIAGNEYYFAVGPYGATGTPPASYTVTVAEQVPPSDPCLKVATAQVGTNSLTMDPNVPDLALTGTAVTVYSCNFIEFVPVADGVFTVSNCDDADFRSWVVAFEQCGDGSSWISGGSGQCNVETGIGPGITSFQGIGGVTYYIGVGGYSAADVLPAVSTIQIDAAYCTPNFDACATGNVTTVIEGSNTVPVDCGAADLDLAGLWTPAFGLPAIANANYMKFVATADALMRVSACGQCVDSRLAVLTECGTANEGTFVAADDDGCDDACFSSAVSFNAVAGQTYYIAIGGYVAAGGRTPLPAEMIVDVGVAADPCSDAVTGIVGVNSVPTNPEFPSLAASCGFDGAPISKASYVRFVAPATATYIANSCAGTQVDTVMSVLSTCGDAASEIACDDDGCGDLRSSVSWDAVQGETYYIAVGLWDPADPLGAEFTVEISTATPPLDPCDPANIGIAQIGDNIVVPDSASPAFDVTGSPCVFEFGADAIARAKFLRFIPSTSGLHLFEQCGDTGASVDARLALMTTCGDAQTILICDDDGCTGGLAPFTSRFEWELTQGQTYYLAVGGFSATTAGPFNVVISGPTPQQCTGDLNNDLVVNGLDLGILLGAWGPCGAPCPADLNGDGAVNGQDLGILLGAWGACP